jgi:hypothetical protein
MDAQSAAPTTLRRIAVQPPLTSLLRWTVAASAMLLFLMSIVLLARRAAGALREPLAAPELLAAGAVLAIAAACLRLLGQAAEAAAGSSGADRWWRALPTVALVVVGVSLSARPPAVPVWALLSFWAMLAVEEGGWWLVLRRRGPWASRPGGDQAGGRATTRSGGIGAPLQAGARHGGTTAGAARDVEAAAAEPLPPGVSQQITRARLDDGVEVLHGLLRGDFAPGQRSQSLHVAFCPPLERTPEIKVEQIEGPRASLKVGEVQSYGARMDLRLPTASSHPVSVLVRLDVRAAPTEETPGAALAKA